MKRLNKLLDQIEAKVPYINALDKEVSLANVAWHLEHSLLVLNGIVEATKNSNPKAYTRKFNLLKTVVFVSGKIPRGKGKSPKAVRPLEGITEDGLLKHIAETKDHIKTLKNLQKNQFFKHPYFGNLNLKQTIQFLEIHTKHHLKIIEDIVKQSR